MKPWQALVLAALSVAVVIVLVLAVNLALPLLSSSPRLPTWTAIVPPKRSPPTPTPQATSTATVGVVYQDPYLACLKGTYDDLTVLMGQLQEASSDEIVLCNLVPAAIDDMFDIRLAHARCPDPADPTLSLLEFAFTTALEYGDSYLSNMDAYCEDADPWSLQMASDDLQEMAHWLREASIQLADYASP